MTSNVRRSFWRGWCAFSVICAAIWHAPLASGAEPGWPKEPYRYLVIDQDLRDVLDEFGHNTGIPVRISDGVTRRRIRNEFDVSLPRDFLQRICERYGLVWYFDGAILYVSDESEIQTEQLSTGSVGPAKLVAELTALGGADSRFPIRAAEAGSLIVVSGPPPYRDFVRQTINALERSNRTRRIEEVMDGDTLKVRVFKGRQHGF
ncbi:MAG: secretin N-terminal domain-containing protein [Rhodomicrobiaceae bacterium]